MRTRAWLAVAVAGVAMGLASRASLANSVSVYDFATGSGNWQVVGANAVLPVIDPIFVGNSNTPITAVPISNVNSAWLSATTVNGLYNPNPGAQWIGARADGGSTGYWGDYTFTLQMNFADFVPPVAGNTALALEFSAVFSSDNEVTSINLVSGSSTINVYTFDPAHPAADMIYEGPNYQNAAYSFQAVFDLSSSGFDLSNPITLQVNVHNDAPGDEYDYVLGRSGQSSPDPGNPMGLIMGGSLEVVSVPLPTAAAVGLPMLAGLALVGGLRRFRRKVTS